MLSQHKKVRETVHLKFCHTIYENWLIDCSVIVVWLNHNIQRCNTFHWTSKIILGKPNIALTLQRVHVSKWCNVLSATVYDLFPCFYMSTRWSNIRFLYFGVWYTGNAVLILTLYGCDLSARKVSYVVIFSLRNAKVIGRHWPQKSFLLSVSRQA